MHVLIIIRNDNMRYFISFRFMLGQRSERPTVYVFTKLSEQIQWGLIYRLTGNKRTSYNGGGGGPPLYETPYRYRKMPL